MRILNNLAANAVASKSFILQKRKGQQMEKHGPLANHLSRRDFLTLLGGGTAALWMESLMGEESPGAHKPNIVIIVSDDQGYGDVGFHGCKDIPTPNLDSLAKSGVRFTDGYVSCPVCSPTRAGLMTGRYQQRFGHEMNPGGRPEHGLPLSQITLANLLKSAGYATGIVGKWHLGMTPEHHPQKRGFDEFFGFLSGAHSYLDPLLGTPNAIMRGTQPVDEKEYLTDAFTREAVSFIERHRKHPFFLYLPYNAVHTPLHATEKYLSRFKEIPDERRRTYAAMLSAMDDGIGAVLKKLRDSGLEKDTLIFFFSDNGGPPANGSSNGSLRAYKGTVYEGGIRVPFLLRWPEKIPAGVVCHKPVISLDVLPTALAAAGGRLPTDRPMDGVNLLPYTAGEKSDVPHELLFWRMRQNKAVRKGNWKLVIVGETPPQLFDLSKDIGETNDLAADKPDVVKELSGALAKWESQMVPPLWSPQARPRPARRAVTRKLRPAVSPK